MFKPSKFVGIILVASTFSANVAFADFAPASCRALKRVRNSLTGGLSLSNESREEFKELAGLALASSGSIYAVKKFMNARTLLEVAKSYEAFGQALADQRLAELGVYEAKSVSEEALVAAQDAYKVAYGSRSQAARALYEATKYAPSSLKRIIERNGSVRLLGVAANKEMTHGMVGGSIAFLGLTLLFDADDLNATEDKSLRVQTAKAVLDPNMPEGLACAAIEQDPVLKYRIFQLQQALQQGGKSGAMATSVNGAQANSSDSKKEASSPVVVANSSSTAHVAR